MRSLILTLTFLCTCGLAPLNAQFTLALEGGVGYGIYNHEPALPDPTTDPASEEQLRAVGGDALALNLGYAPADQKLVYGLRLQYLSRGYQHIYIERPENAIIFRDELTSEIRFLDILPALTYNVGRQLSFGGGPYYSVALNEKNTPDNLGPDQRLHRQDYGLHLNGRFSIGRFYLWTQYQHSLQTYDLSTFAAAYPAVRPIQDPSPVSVFMFGLGFQIIR